VPANEEHRAKSREWTAPKKKGREGMTELIEMDAVELVRWIREGRVSPLDVMEATFERIDAVNPLINAFVSLRREEALQEAKEMTESLASGAAPGPLVGIPIGVKDLEDVKGMVTSFGSIPYRNNVAQHDSVQVARLKSSGAIVVGKTNTPEFGFTGFTKNRLYGVTRNPWNTDRTPGGSSGGSAAAVAARMVPMATGSDAGGSIRIPASYSGCFGMKTSFGRIPLGPSPFLQMYRLWTLGPLTRTVRDAALYLDCASGYHPSDPDSLPSPSVSFLDTLDHSPERLRIAFSPTLGYARVQKDVLERVEEGVRCFEDMGHKVELWKGEFPDVGDTWSFLMNAELYGILHQSLDRNRKDMGRTLVQSLDLAKGGSLREEIEAQKMRTTLNRLLWDLFETYDVLLTPTMPTEAFSAGGPPPAEVEGHPIPLLGAVAFTYPFNLCGHPAASVPTGLTKEGLPAGLQIVGPRHREDLVLQTAYAFEKRKPWKAEGPDMVL
jgi:aspartyl-tRNA(Asn)/glutamyl-tRNA(Gln) amidotransferase subunit A